MKAPTPATPAAGAAGPETPEQPRVPSRRSALRAALHEVEPALLLFLVARATGLSLMIFFGPDSPGYALRRLAVHWDAYWYLDIAQHGYDHAIRPLQHGGMVRSTNLAFFPLYPGMIRALHTLLPFAPWGLCGLAVASLCALGAAAGIYFAVSFRYGRKVGTLAALLWGASPLAAVETAGYSESAFTLFAAWALYCAVSRRWLTAGLLSVLAGLTRPTGVAVAAAVMTAAALELWPQLRHRGADPHPAPPEPGPAPWRPAAAIVLAPLGWLGFVAWTGLRLHTWDAYFRIQALWHSSFDFGHKTLYDVRQLFVTANPVGLYYPVVAGILAAAAVLLVVTVAQRQPLAFVVFSLMILVIAYGDTAFFSSRGRFVMPAFPLLIPIASGLARVRTRTVLVSTLAACTLLSGLYGTYVLMFADRAP